MDAAGQRILDGDKAVIDPALADCGKDQLEGFAGHRDNCLVIEVFEDGCLGIGAGFTLKGNLHVLIISQASLKRYPTPSSVRM